VAAARALFAAQGFADVSNDAIVAAAGVKRRTARRRVLEMTGVLDGLIDGVTA